MKVGMIFECGDQGADIKVCVQLAKRIRPEVIVEPDPLSNKKNLLKGCGSSAAQLFAIGCERVLIIWDLYPNWKRDEDPCLHEDREEIFRSLKAEGVATKDVALVCIKAELEAWLLTDERALSEVMSKPHRKVKVQRQKNTDRHTDPKARLTDLFYRHIGRPYRELWHAEQIIQAMPDLKRLQRVESFRRFENKLSN